MENSQVSTHAAGQTSLDGAPPPAGTSSNKLHTYFEQLPVAVAVFRGAGQVFDFINAAYCDLVGKTPPDLLNRSLFAVYPELRGTATERFHEMVWQTGQLQEVQEQPVTFERDGRPYEGFFNIKYQPLKNAANETEGVIAVGYEVTELVRARNTLAESQAQAVRLANAMPQVVWMAQPDGAVTYYNQRVAEFAGATQTPDGTWHWEGVVHPDDLAATVAAWQQAVATGRVYEQEHRIHMRDGSYRWHLSRGIPQVDAEGLVLGWVGTATDIDEQKQAEEALTYQKGLLETVTGNTTLALFLMDDHQHCIYMNEAAEEMTGFKLAELQGKQLHYSIHHTHPDGRHYPLEDCPIDRALPQKRREQGEEVFVHRDGSFYSVAFTASPIIIGEKAIGTVIEVRNTTEEKKQQQALRESEERFRTLAEALPHLVWMTDARGAYEYASRQWSAYSGLDPRHPDTWASMVHPDDLSPLTQTWRHCVQTGQTYKAEVRLRRMDGEFRWHSVHGEPMRDETGQIVRWIGAFADIHEQKAFAEELEKLVSQRTQALYESNQFLEERNTQLLLANKELESFNYVVSHDLKEPLRKIQAFISFLELKNTSEAKRAELLDRIDASAQHMANLLHGILSYSRLANPENEFVSTDLNAILAQVRSDYELILEEKNGTLESGILPTIRAIPLQMSQLFANLISNSLKFTDKPPQIVITATEPAAAQLPPSLNPPVGQWYTAITFRDNGIGFEPQYAPKIFTLFQRLHARQTYDGTGIGLTICKKIVDNHHGFITAEGRLGEGAIFTIYLPIRQPEAHSEKS